MIRIHRLNRIVLNSLLFKETYKVVAVQSKRHLAISDDKQHQETRQEFKQSYDYKTNFSEDKLKEKILENSLEFVPEHGFTKQALIQGALSIGLSTASVNQIFQNGSFDLIDYFYKKQNEKLSIYLENLVKEGKVAKKNELIRSAIIYRLTLIQPYIKHWPDAMATQSFYLNNALPSIENLLRLCDEIWYLVGDKSSDFNWYTKRVTLALIYKSTEIFMIQDKSENFAETIRFLDSRFNDLTNLYKFNQEVSLIYS